MTNEEIIEKLKVSNVKEVSRMTSIPYDRMAKWMQGKGKPKKDDADKLIEYFNGSKSSKVPFYDVEAMAGNNTNAEMMPVTEPTGTIDVGDMLRDSECAIRIYGNSMIPNYPSGCVVGLQTVNDGIVEYGNVYVVETDDNRYLKRLLKDPEGKGYMCYSDNVMKFADGPLTGHYCYEPFVIPFSTIRRLYRVTGSIKRNTNSTIYRNQN